MLFIVQRSISSAGPGPFRPMPFQSIGPAESAEVNSGEVCVGIVVEAVRLRASVRAVFPWNDAGASRKLLVGSAAPAVDHQCSVNCMCISQGSCA